MTLLTPHRKIEELALALDGGRPSDDPDVAPLAALALSLRAAAPAVAPAPDFRDALRQRLVAVATVQPANAPAASDAREGVTWKVQRRVAAVAGSLAAVTAMAGVGVAATKSLPGDPFYGVKKATEGVQLATASGNVAKGQRHLEFARTRLHEVADLPSSDRAHVTSTLATMDAETRSGANDLLAAFRSGGSARPLEILGAFDAKQYGDLAALLPSLTGAERQRAEQSMALVAGIHATVQQLAGVAPSTTTPGGTGTGPGTVPSVSPRPASSSTSSPTTGVTTAPTPRSSSGSGSGSGSTTTPAHGGGSGTVPSIPPLPKVTGLPVPLPTPSSLLPTGVVPTTLVPTGVVPTAVPSLPGLLGH